MKDLPNDYPNIHYKRITKDFLFPYNILADKEQIFEYTESLYSFEYCGARFAVCKDCPTTFGPLDDAEVVPNKKGTFSLREVTTGLNVGFNYSSEKKVMSEGLEVLYKNREKIPSAIATNLHNQRKKRVAKDFITLFVFLQ